MERQPTHLPQTEVTQVATGAEVRRTAGHWGLIDDCVSLETETESPSPEPLPEASSTRAWPRHIPEYWAIARSSR